VWGASLWTSGARVYESFTFNALPQHQRTNIAGIFAQYEFSLVPDRLRLIAGSKLDHNTYTGMEIQPQIRGVWTPFPAHTFWAAVSRAVRTPGRHETSVRYALTQLPGPMPTFLMSEGNPGLKSEALRAYEIGYRFNPSTRVSMDGTIFYNHYDNLTNVNLLNPMSVGGPPVVHQNPTFIEIPVPWQNIGSGQTHGAEFYLKVVPLQRWELSGSVTELRGNSVNANDTLNLPIANTTKHQFNLQSRLNLTSRLSFDSGLYHYGGIAGYRFAGIPAQDVATHNRLDIGVSFRPRKDFTFSVWGRDVTANDHWETRPFLFTTTGSGTGPMMIFKLTWENAGND
jgi:iron complex outermembrane receptor protein